MLRHLLAEGAYYSCEYQESAGADPKFIKVPAKPKPGESPEKKMEAFDKTIFKNIMKDEGYFSSLDPMKRVALAEKTFDVRRIPFAPAQGRCAENRPWLR